MNREPESILSEYLNRPRALTDEFVKNFPWDRIKLEAIDHRLIPILQYMRNIETLTEVYFEELRRTPTYRNPVVKTFMEHWREEEAQHGILLDRFLAEAGFPSPENWVQGLRKEIPFRYRFDSGFSALVSRLVGKNFSAVHLLWGAINEMVTLQGYRRLDELAGHSLLGRLLKGIMSEEAIHIFFYFNMGSHFLKSRFAQKVARAVITRYWQPVGSGIRPAEETNLVSRVLFGESQALRSLSKQVDGRIRTLPGFADFDTIGRVVGGAMAA